MQLRSNEGGPWTVETVTPFVSGSNLVFDMPALNRATTVSYQIYHTFGSCGTFFNNTVTVVSQATSGDTQANPIVIGSIPSTITGSNDSDSFTNTYTMADGGENAPDVFYRFTAPACAEEITISTCDSDINTVVHVLQADGTLFATADDNSCGDDEAITFSATPFTDYVIVVEGAGAAVGNFELDIALQEFDFDLGEDISLCPGQEATIGVTIPGASYSWNTGATDDLITVSTPGTYEVTITNAAGCVKTNSIAVTQVQDVAPGAPTYLAPVNDDIVDLPVNLIWLPSGDNTYDVYLWEQGTAVPATPYTSGVPSTLPTSIVDVSDALDFGRSYNWQLVTSNACGTQSITGPIATFSTVDLPDFVAQNGTATPVTLFPGDPLTFEWEYFNQGKIDGELIEINQTVFLSADASFIEGEEVELYTERLEDINLPSTSSDTASADLIIPASTPPGDYYLIVQFQTDTQEGNTANNVYVMENPVTVEAIPVPDLTVQNLTYDPSLEAGMDLAISYELFNLGTANIETVVF